MLKDVLLICTVFSFLEILYRAEAQDVKTWNTNMNFNNIKTWKNGRVPCSKQKVIFPASIPVAVYMPESLYITEMILPMNGELVFPENAAINIDGNIQEDDCNGGEAEFLPSMDFWYDPENWNITSNRAFPRKASTRNAAVPHAYQIPCRFDEVWFPVDTTFKVHIIYKYTKISKLVIGYEEYDQEDFNFLVRTSTGKLLFPDLPRLHISRMPCVDITGCVCGNEAYDVLPTICKFNVPCPELKCADPIRPIGHCCDMCAAQILADYDSNFKMDSLMQLYDRYLNKEEFQEVESFTSKTTEGSVQSIFVQKTQGNQMANKVAQLIHDTLLADTSGAHSYAIRSLKIQKSELWDSGDSQYERHSSTGYSSGAVTAIIILVILVICLAIAFYIYKRRQIPGFSFARFDLRGDRIELELGTTPHEALEPEEIADSSKSEELNQAFDNPVYGTNVSAEPTPESILAKSIEGKDIVENPMFMIFEDSLKEGKE